jgi:hypothetical protein
MVESARFDITNTKSLLRKISTEDLKAFNFDVKCIDWAHYFSNVDVPGAQVTQIGAATQKPCQQLSSVLSYDVEVLSAVNEQGNKLVQ